MLTGYSKHSDIILGSNPARLLGVTKIKIAFAPRPRYLYQPQTRGPRSNPRALFPLFKYLSVYPSLLLYHLPLLRLHDRVRSSLIYIPIEDHNTSNMTTAGPSDGGSNPEGLKDKLKHPFDHMREKFRDTKLYDLKVGLIHKK